MKSLENLVGSMKNLLHRLCLVEALLTVSLNLKPSVTQAGSLPLRRPGSRPTVTTFSRIRRLITTSRSRLRASTRKSWASPARSRWFTTALRPLANGSIATGPSSRPGLSEHRSLSNNYFDEWRRR